jgi:SAM-dependent methyltransferase
MPEWLGILDRDVVAADLEMTSTSVAAPAEAAIPEWRCPTHGTELQHTHEALVCRHGESFPVRNGIPRFADEDYAKPFGLQWNRYRLTQLDSYTHTTFSRDRARRCIGEEVWQRLAGMQVLECGCGAGRFTEALLDRGGVVTSVDLTGAVDANQKTFPQGPSHRIAQADILALPFEPRRFDLVFCLGVIQHTPSPELTIARLYEHVKPGGWLVFDHYAYRLGWYLSLKPLYRRALRRLPAEKGLSYTERLVDLFLPLHRRSRPVQMLANRISPVYSYYEKTPELSDDVHRSWALLDTYDGLMDWYKWFRTETQIRRILEQLRLERIWTAPGGNGIEARGRRPPWEPE